MEYEVEEKNDKEIEGLLHLIKDLYGRVKVLEGLTHEPLEVKKVYPWYEYDKATEESGKSLAELFDFKSGMLIWTKDSDES